jgi:mannitol-1-phosphate 5-dehydrogenase
VDRICSSNWPNDLTIDTEKYGELSIDANTAGNINVKEIPSIDNIEAAFMRKRLLLNTFADASAFMALSTNKKYLSEAIIDEEIQRKLTPYFQSFDLLLVENYNYTQKEVNYWKELYRSRLSNSKINRNLDTVARNLWEKLTLEERFIFPLVELYKKGEKIDESIHVIVQMIKIYTDIEPYQIFEKLKKLWRGNEAGEEMLKITKHYLDV